MSSLRTRLTRATEAFATRNPAHRDTLETTLAALEDGALTDDEAFRQVLPAIGALLGKSSFVELTSALEPELKHVQMGRAAVGAFRDLAALGRAFELGLARPGPTPSGVREAFEAVAPLLGKTLDEVLASRPSTTLQSDTVEGGARVRRYRAPSGEVLTRHTTDSGDTLEHGRVRLETYRLRLDERGRQTDALVIASGEVQGDGFSDVTMTKVSTSLRPGSAIHLEYELRRADLTPGPSRGEETWSTDGAVLSQRLID